jgi:predicted metal-dependent hydrolase
MTSVAAINANGVHGASGATPVAAGASLHDDRQARPIPVRRPLFDFSRVAARHWFGGDPFLSHMANAMSLTFPEGERFFMDAVKHYADRVTSPALKQEVSRFMGQEALHSRAHEAYNAWLRTTGLDPQPIEQRVKEGLQEVRTHRSHRYQLAMTCALEHFTAMMAELLLEGEDLRELMDPEVRRLLVWHAIEETEHKAVAFDVYTSTGGSYRTRVIAMLVTTLGFTISVALFQAALMRQDPETQGARGVGHALSGIRKVWIWPGYFRRLIPSYLDYFRRDFHPWDRPAPAGLEAFKAELKGDVIRD